jgi:NitT/TauT family transport system substrate-binding protein
MKTSNLFFVRSGEQSMLGRLLKTALGLVVSLLALSTGPLPMKIGTVVWFGYGPFYVAKAQDLYRRYKLKDLMQVVAGVLAKLHLFGQRI